MLNCLPLSGCVSPLLHIFTCSPPRSVVSEGTLFSHQWSPLISPPWPLHPDGFIVTNNLVYAKIFLFLKYLIEIHFTLLLYLSCFSVIEILMFCFLSMSQDRSTVASDKALGKDRMWVQSKQQRFTGSEEGCRPAGRGKC